MRKIFDRIHTTSHGIGDRGFDDWNIGEIEMMTKDNRDEIDGWWIITSYDQPQGPYFSKKGEPIDEYKGMNVYAVDGSCRGDFHDCELKEIEAHESAKIIDALDEKDAEIERLNERMAQMIREHQGQYTFARDIKDFVVTELCRALREIESDQDELAHDRLKKARDTIESVQPGISKLSEARSRVDLTDKKGGPQ